ncbi:hypothetical protein FVE85_4755 [Porphyridium purpureum]|uniref:C2 domain-containing protein n=1 Tax=Porphyridium purpureum TaxID=35688 RepID=A0A5J4YQL9_PORPP|nr:hypothetical protein FVE85_4755 [Porphyridium purpureum]|eukprot:POR5766..scf236_6
MKQVQLSVAAYNLPGRALGIHDPYAVVLSRPSVEKEWKDVGKTEEAQAQYDPNFTKKFHFPYGTDEEKNVQLQVKFCSKALKKDKVEVLGMITTTLAAVYESDYKCLDFQLKSETGGDLNGGQSFVFLSCEMVDRSVKDSIAFRFRFGEAQGYGGHDGEAYSYFVVSRELKHSLGQWARVFQSRMIDPPVKKGKSKATGNDEDEESQIAKTTSDVMYCNDPERRLLVEYYTYRPKPKTSLFSRLSSRDSAGSGSVGGQGDMDYGHQLVASTQFTAASLPILIKSKTPMRFEIEPGGMLQRGEIGLDNFSFFSMKPNTPKMLIFVVDRLVWYSTVHERDKAADLFESYVERDMWARLITSTAEGEQMEKNWVGSSYRGFTNLGANPAGGGLAKPSKTLKKAPKPVADTEEEPAMKFDEMRSALDD